MFDEGILKLLGCLEFERTQEEIKVLLLGDGRVQIDFVSYQTLLHGSKRLTRDRCDPY
jgi:hypothetical protein